MFLQFKKTPVWKQLLCLLLAIWVMYSGYYILSDQWKKFERVHFEKAYQQGVADSVLAIMNESEKCELISVFEGEKKVQLIPVDCLPGDKM